jgi:sulfopyruvate decarboxylase subunit beta
VAAVSVRMMALTKETVISAVTVSFSTEPIVFSTGYISRIAHHLRDRPNHFYMVGSMGLASSFGAGLAARVGRRTVVVDGDGSFLMGLNGLLLRDDLAGADHLVHLVLNDGEYDSTGGQPGPASTRRISALAYAAGYAKVYEVNDARSLDRALSAVAAAPVSGPILVHCRVVASHAAPPRILLELPDIFTRLRGYLTGTTVRAGTPSPA